MVDILEIAIRKKYRFNTSKGEITLEDLWDLPLTSTTGKPNLDDIARELHAKLKSGIDISFVNTAKKSDETVQQKFDIVRRVIEVKLAENAAAINAKANAEKKQQFLALIAEKENAEVAALPLDKLRELVASM